MPVNALPLIVTLTVANVAVAVSAHLGAASARDAPEVIRARALEIVDERGNVRASIKLQPAGRSHPDGASYPETVILRLIDRNGRPEVKIAASERGAGLSFVGDSDETRVLLHAEGSRAALRLASRDGAQRLIEP
jgi:hypothetical protein